MTSSQFETYLKKHTQLPAGRVTQTSRFLRSLDLWPYTIGEDARNVTAKDAARFLIALALPEEDQFTNTCLTLNPGGVTFLNALTRLLEQTEQVQHIRFVAISATRGVYGAQIWTHLIDRQGAIIPFMEDSSVPVAECLTISGGLLNDLHLLILKQETVLN